MRVEDWPRTFQQLLQLGVLSIRNQCIIHRDYDGIVIGDFVVDVSLVEFRAAQATEFLEVFITVRFQAAAGVALFRGELQFFSQSRGLFVY